MELKLDDDEGSSKLNNHEVLIETIKSDTATNPFNELVVIMDQLWQPNSELSRAIAEKVKPFIDIASQISLLVNDVNKKHALMISSSFEVSVEDDNAFLQFQDNIVQMHTKQNLIIAPFLTDLTLNQIREIMLVSEGNLIHAYQKIFESEENVTKILAIWQKDDFLGRRYRILKAAMDAHLRKEYELSIPVFLNQIEGILCEIMSSKKNMFCKNSFSKFVSKISESDDISVRALKDNDLLTEVLCRQIFESTGNLSRRNQAPQYPPRNEINHGSNITYFEDQFASVRCILILDLLRIEQFKSGYDI